MPLSIHPLRLGDAETDTSFLVWGRSPGRRMTVRSPRISSSEETHRCWWTRASASAEDAKKRGMHVFSQTEDQTLEAALEPHGLRPSDVATLVLTHPLSSPGASSLRLHQPQAHRRRAGPTSLEPHEHAVKDLAISVSELEGGTPRTDISELSASAQISNTSFELLRLPAHLRDPRSTDVEYELREDREGANGS